MTADAPAAPVPSPRQMLVLYDGVCGLCNRLVAFLLRHERGDRFQFATLQSKYAETLLCRHGIDRTQLDSVVVVENFGEPNEVIRLHAQAALLAVAHLGGVWRVVRIWEIVPLTIQNGLYDLIARNRYRIFGRHERCPMPPANYNHKFRG